MGGRRRLVGGFSSWLPDHRRAEGLDYRRYLRAAEEIVGPINGSHRLRAEVHRYAVAGVLYERASRVWAETCAQRAQGKGRRPSEREVERCARRQGLADLTLKEATARLEALAGRRSTPAATPEELMRRLRDEAEAADA